MRGSVYVRVVGVHGKPRRTCGEPRLSARVPLHGRTRVVAADSPQGVHGLLVAASAVLREHAVCVVCFQVVALLHAREREVIQHGVEVVHRAEHRCDCTIVRNVVTVIVHGARIDGAQPYDVDAEPGQIRKAHGYAGQIAHAVSVAVLEALRIDLVDDRPLPPLLAHVRTLSEQIHIWESCHLRACAGGFGGVVAVGDLALREHPHADRLCALGETRGSGLDPLSSARDARWPSRYSRIVPPIKRSIRQ